MNHLLSRCSRCFFLAAAVVALYGCPGADNNGGATNGGTNGAKNGATNGGTNGATNGANGDTNGANGDTNGGTNGDTNGGTNGDTNSATNGDTNGATNNGTNNTNNMTGCPDALEPNDAKADATPVMSGDVIESRLCDDDDLDLFAVELSSRQTLTATARFAADTHNFDMTLFDADQAENYSTGDLGVAYTSDVGEVPEVLEYTAEADGTYYLLMFNNNFAAADYSIEFEVE